MNFLLDILAFVQVSTVYVQWLYEEGKQYLRTWLGPGKSNYIVLESQEVLPEHVRRSFAQDDTALRYASTDQSLRPLIAPSTSDTPRLQRLPWISLIHRHAETTTDLSEWMSEVRCTRPITLLQCVRLGALVHNLHLPENGQAVVEVQIRAGGVEVYRYTGSTQLEKF